VVRAYRQLATQLRAQGMNEDHMSAADLTPTLEDAIVLAAQWHRGQIYPSVRGEPFILHPLRVMAHVESDIERIVAVLHDVIEDTDCTFGDLRRLGYSERVIEALDRLTHRDGEAYETYIERIKDDPLARQVKLADLGDNLANNRRIAEVASSTEARERIVRYERTIEQLRAAAAAAPANAEPPR
jgi:(p)ppGpp synthase/HD superfamily hydrolase